MRFADKNSVQRDRRLKDSSVQLEDLLSRSGSSGEKKRDKALATPLALPRQ